MMDGKLVAFADGVRFPGRESSSGRAGRLRATMIRESTTTTGVPGWEALLPWLRAGTTRRGRGSRSARIGDGWRSVVRSRQVHGAATKLHASAPAGESVVGDGDGHLTRVPGLLLTVTLADCTPVFMADPAHRAVALLHAGWRGTAAGVLEEGVAAMQRAFASEPGDLLVHLGPAICGECYEVGPEVFEALGEAPPSRPAPVDLRGVIRRRALATGIHAGRVSVSGECTLCGDGRYFSHRRGDTGRHRAFIGILPRASGRG